MKINRLFALALIAVLAIAAMSMFAMQAVAQTSEPGSIETEHEGQYESEHEDLDDSEDEGPDVPITGDALEKASAVALEFVGEGRVTETEVGDEEGYYEIEVTLDSGRQTDVHLGEAFNVLGQEVDEADDD